MGLAAAKNKRKLGTDPNNTKWSRNAEGFGQKFLRAQGWEPGQYLGAKDASHAEFHTEASSSHIRITLKDDQLGLGAKRNNGDECTGLDAFQHLLGRLNGKSEDLLEAERRKREEAKLGAYVERKLGSIRFVKGGWLVGDQVTEVLDEGAVEGTVEPQVAPQEDVSASSAEEREEPKTETKRSKKRKAEKADEADDNEGGFDRPTYKGKKDKKSKRRKADTETETDHMSKSQEKKSKRKTGGDENDVETSGADAKESKKERKERKEQKKRDKKEEKERRRREKASSGSATEEADDNSRKKKRRKEDSDLASVGDGISESSASNLLGSGASTPNESGYSTPVTTTNRYLSRQRFIAQKRLAFADTAAMNQIFMIKS